MKLSKLTTTLRLKSWNLAFMMAMAAFAPGAHAGIMADLNDMFMSNSTAPGTLTTRDRHAVIGGGVSVRMPVKAINLVSFDPPRLNAGCGGVDLYGGSFSFINGEELIAVFRNVASNAAGLAFKAAIKAISPSLDGLISEFQTTLQVMNNLAKNSCSLAHLIVDPAAKAISNAIDGDGNVAGVEKGMFTDMTAGLAQFRENATEYFKKSGEVTPNLGNQVYKAVIDSGAGGILGIAGLPNADGSADDASNPNSLNNRILVSILGYGVSGQNCTSQNQDNIADTSGTEAANNLSRIMCRSAATLTLDDFVNGGGTNSNRPDNPLILYKCVNPDGTAPTNGGYDYQKCTIMKREDYHYKGIKGWINMMMFGSPDDSTLEPDSIVGRMSYGGSSSLTAEQIKFIKQANVPLIGLLQKTSNPTTRLKIARMLRTPIENCVAAQLGVALYKSANSIGNNNTYDIGPDSKAEIQRLRDDYTGKQVACANDKNVLDVIQMLNGQTSLTTTATR